MHLLSGNTRSISEKVTIASRLTRHDGVEMFMTDSLSSAWLTSALCPRVVYMLAVMLTISYSMVVLIVTDVATGKWLRTSRSIDLPRWNEHLRYGVE